MSRPIQALARMAAYAAILGAVVILPHVIAYAIVPATTHGAIDAVFPACETEDSSNCVWIANLNGNGSGRSFIDVNNRTFYFPR